MVDVNNGVRGSANLIVHVAHVPCETANTIVGWRNIVTEEHDAISDTTKIVCQLVHNLRASRRWWYDPRMYVCHMENVSCETAEYMWNVRNVVRRSARYI